VSNAPLRLGVLGLGRAFTLMLPTFRRDPRLKLVAAFDPREAATAAFAREFGGSACANAEAVCADPQVEWVYVATPHQLHVEHVQLAAAHGKHVLVEKPMAIALDDCTRMIEACKRAGTQLVVGHSHSFNAPVLQARRMIASGRFGAVRMIHALNFTDFLYRPRRPEELDTAQGGGVVFSQAAHQVDIVRLLGGGFVQTVYARTGAWDTARPTEGAYSALLTFHSGAFASLSYSGYGFYDSDALMGGVGEMGRPKAAGAHQQTRRKLATAASEAEEARLKAERNFGGADYVPELGEAPSSFQHFGPVLVCCDAADLRLTMRRASGWRRCRCRRCRVPKWSTSCGPWGARGVRRCTTARGRAPRWRCAWPSSNRPAGTAISCCGTSSSCRAMRRKCPIPRPIPRPLPRLLNDCGTGVNPFPTTAWRI
jgi:phthalate 4,5-cis-dihydrodiol dehydrogenase